MTWSKMLFIDWEVKWWIDSLYYITDANEFNGVFCLDTVKLLHTMVAKKKKKKTAEEDDIYNVGKRKRDKIDRKS